MALLLLAGMQTIPEELYEAAAIDGASPVKQFFSITFPLLKPAMAVALIFRTLDALRVFDVFQVLLGQSQYSMATYNYFQLIGNRNMGLASAIGVVIFIIIFGFAIAYIKMLGVDMDETA
jgi:trehalose/maltose transport system permease protein